MSEWKPKRFWTASAVVATDGGYTVELDGRRVRTPAKALLEVLIPALPEHMPCACDRALENAILTSADAIPEDIWDAESAGVKCLKRCGMDRLRRLNRRQGRTTANTVTDDK